MDFFNENRLSVLSAFVVGGLVQDRMEAEMLKTINNAENVLDSRDINARIEMLKAEQQEIEAELNTLEALAEEARPYVDWEDGANSSAIHILQNTQKSGRKKSAQSRQRTLGRSRASIGNGQPANFRWTIHPSNLTA